MEVLLETLYAESLQKYQFTSEIQNWRPRMLLRKSLKFTKEMGLNSGIDRANP
jgi:hypothetical protein